MDYSSPTLFFTYNNEPILLKADASQSPTTILAQQIKCCVQTHASSKLFHIQIIQPTNLISVQLEPSKIHVMVN